jgi:NADH:ubiquinone oxidoreductase subunit 5 (subunit L)/multisubunit Na+/H+ antiporter MnhA subunit
VEGSYPGGSFSGFLGTLFAPDSTLAVLLLVMMAVYLAMRIARDDSSSLGDDHRPPESRASLLEALTMLAVGVLIAFFVGFGIQAFYPAPELTEERFGPTESSPADPEGKEKFKEMKEEELALRVYHEEVSEYSRIDSLIAVGIAVLILGAVLLLRRIRIPAIRDGMALGGVLTLFYGLVLALQAEGDVFKFLMVALVLLVVLVAGYLRFRPEGRPGTPAS